MVLTCTHVPVALPMRLQHPPYALTRSLPPQIMKQEAVLACLALAALLLGLALLALGFLLPSADWQESAFFSI